MRTKLRTGFATGYDRDMTVREIADLMRQIEERGYEHGFFSETRYLFRDGVTALAAMSLATQRMTVGHTQIVRLRTPVVMAQTLLTLDELAEGRLILAPGACIPVNSRQHSLEHVAPLQTLKEWVESIRLLMTGEPVDYEGHFVKLKNVQIRFKPVRTRIPMWFASTSQSGLRLAGALGDGVLLNASTSPEYSANAVRILREAVAEAGRDWSTFEVAQLINCSLDDDMDRAVEAVRWEIASKFDPTISLLKAGPRLRVGEPAIRTEDFPMLIEAHQRGGRDNFVASLPKSWIQGLAACGPAKEIERRVQQFRDAGVRLPVLRPAARYQVQPMMELFAPN